MIRPWPYVAAGLCLAAVVAGAIVGAEFAAFIWIASVVEGGNSQGAGAYSLLAAIVASLGFLVGLIFPGVPIWLWLHGIGRRSYLNAALAGAIGASTAGVVLSLSSGLLALVSIGWLVAPGAVAGMVLRWAAYSRT